MFDAYLIKVKYNISIDINRNLLVQIRFGSI